MGRGQYDRQAAAQKRAAAEALFKTPAKIVGTDDDKVLAFTEDGKIGLHPEHVREVEPSPPAPKAAPAPRVMAPITLKPYQPPAHNPVLGRRIEPVAVAHPSNDAAHPKTLDAALAAGIKTQTLAHNMAAAASLERVRTMRSEFEVAVTEALTFPLSEDVHLLLVRLLAQL